MSDACYEEFSRKAREHGLRSLEKIDPAYGACQRGLSNAITKARL
jgi:hypothetical protein